MARTRDKDDKRNDKVKEEAEAEAEAFDEAVFAAAEAIASERKWNFAETLLMIVGVLGGAALGAFIFYLATKNKQGVLGAVYYPPQPAVLPPQPMVTLPPNDGDLPSKVEKIKTLVRTANKSTSSIAGLTNASYALALLEDAQTTFGEAALTTLCDPDKLRKLIKRIQDQHGAQLSPT